MKGDSLEDKQWITTAILAALFTSTFMYLPAIGGLWVFIIVCLGQGAYLGWQHVSAAQARLGGLTFGAATMLLIPVMGLIFRPDGPGNLWPIAAAMGLVPGLVVMWGARFARSRRAL